MVITEQQLSVHIRSARLKFEDRAKPDILNALRTFPALNVDVKNHKFPDGIERPCLCLHGTIPVKYKVRDYHDKLFNDRILEQRLQYSYCVIFVRQSSLFRSLLLRLSNERNVNKSV